MFTVFLVPGAVLDSEWTLSVVTELINSKVASRVLGAILGAFMQHGTAAR